MPEAGPASVLFLDQTGQLGGAELCLADIAAARREHATVALFQDGPFRPFLTARGVTVVIKTLPAAAVAVDKQARLAALLRAVPSLAGFILDLARLARRHRLVYANTPKAILAGAAASILSGVPLVIHLHDILDRTHFSPLNIFLLRAAVRRARLVIANSRATAASLGPVASGRAVVVPNGFPPAEYPALPPAARTALRATLGFAAFPTIGIFGRLTPWKGQHIVLEAVARLPEVRCLVVGDALFTGADDTYARELRLLADRLGIANRVQFLGFRRDIPELLQAVDIVVHASTSPEPFGRVIVEAMFSERPVVAANAGGAAEILEDGVTGRLVPPGNVTALSAALADLLSAPLQRQELAAAARRTALARYSLPAVQSQLDAALASLLPISATKIHPSIP